MYSPGLVHSPLVRGGRHVTRWSAGVAVALVLACNQADEESAPFDPEPRPAPKSIDEAVQRRLDDGGWVAELADDTELCRRVFADLVGRFPPQPEITESCAGQDLDVVVARLQATDDYVVHGQRRWRDRLGSSDALLYWRDLAPAFDVVAAMLRGELDYRAFAVQLMAEPGLMALDPDAAGRAYRVHRVFLGGGATASIAQDLARLTRIWDQRPLAASTFGNTIQTVPRAYIVPGHCGPLGTCATELYEGGRIEFPDPGPRPFAGIKYELLTDDQKASLRGTGEHVVGLPWFWEAAADELLDRLLGWSDGGSEPRRAGRILPEVRALLVEHLEQTHDIRSGERLVIGSLLYRQTNRVAETPLDEHLAESEDDRESEPAERPIWASGPLKFTPAEVVLNTVRGSSVAAGTCDPRMGDDDIYRQQLFGLGFPTGDDSDEIIADYNEFITEFNMLQGNWRSLVEQEVRDPTDPERTVSVLHLDPSYFEVARAFGGCPGTGAPRLTALDGLTYAYGQEVAANILCEDPEVLAIAGAATTPADAGAAFMSRFLSRLPTQEEATVFNDLVCDGVACTSGAEMAKGVCIALLGTHEMLFY